MSRDLPIDDETSDTPLIYSQDEFEEEARPGFFHRGWRQFKLFLVERLVPFLKKYWFEIGLTTLLLAFTITLIVMLQIYPVLILGIAFITIGNAMPFAFLGSMSVAAATASITAIVLGVGALKIAILSAFKNGITIFASWCWNKMTQEKKPDTQNATDILGESENDLNPEQVQPLVMPTQQPIIEKPIDGQHSSILSVVSGSSSDDDETNQVLADEPTQVPALNQSSPQPLSSPGDLSFFSPGNALNTEKTPDPVETRSDNADQPSNTSSPVNS